MAKRSALGQQHHLRLTPSPQPSVRSSRSESPLLIRTRLRERRPVEVKRHTSRIATRFGVLLAADAIAIFICTVIADLAVSSGGWLGLQFSRALAGHYVGWTFTPILLISLFATGSYSRHRSLNGRVRLLSGTALASTFVVWRMLAAHEMFAAASVFLMTTFLTWDVVCLVRIAAEHFLRTVWPGTRGAAPALLVTDRREESLALENAVLAAGGDYSLAGYVSIGRRQFEGSIGSIGSINELADLIDEHKAETVVVCEHLSDQQITLVRDASLTAGCQLLYPARAVKIAGVRPALVWHQDQPFFELGAPVLKATAVISKRVIDVIAAIVGMVVLSPVFLLIALALKLDSPGPVFFAQDRAGLGGRRFKMLKFRTMRVGADAEKHNLAHLNQSGDSRLFKIPQDPRVTRLGSLLRRWSLDELPQLWNVLWGEMSLVGPRPFFEADFASYQDHHFRRLDAKPGITGLWQVSGRSAVVDFEDVVYLDRQYIEQWSFWLDVSIMFRTLPAIVRRTGAY